MITVFKKIRDLPKEGNRHLMPLSLRYIRILSEAGIDWRGIHIIDAFSLVCALNISAARQVLDAKNKERRAKAGIKEIRSATSEEFDAL